MIAPACLTHGAPPHRMYAARRPLLTDEISVSCLHGTSGSCRVANFVLCSPHRSYTGIHYTGQNPALDLGLARGRASM